MGTESLLAKLTGKIAGSDDNHSGMLTELNSYLKHGGLSEIEQRAKDKGLESEIASWRETETPETTSAQVIKALFSQAEIEELADKTGQNDSGVVSALAMQLPRSISRMAH